MNDDLHLLLLRAFFFILAALFLIAAYFHGSTKITNIRSRRAVLLISLLVMGAACLLPALFFPAWLDRHVGQTSVAVVCLLFYLTMGFLILRKPAGITNERRVENTHFVFKSIEITALVLGILFALHEASHAIEALRQNTQSNKLAGRGQLYLEDSLITSREYQEADGKLLSLYGDSDPSCKDVGEAKKYVKDTLALVTANAGVVESTSAADLYGKIFGKRSFRPFDRSNLRNEDVDMVEVRRMSEHCIQVLDLVHSAYDYCGEGVITEDEFETWAGYLDDIGPHPVFLATLWNWEQKPYMSRGFARYVHYRLFKKANPGSQQVVKLFYPELAQPNYGDALPRYGFDLIDDATGELREGTKAQAK